MAEEKKPKIDLKARLGKTAVGNQTPPPMGAVVPPPGAPSASGSGAPPAPVSSKPVQQAPMGMALPGVPVGPPPGYQPPAPQMDPNNPLAAAVQPYRAPAPPPPAAQRIEFDDVTVQEARKKGMRTGITTGLVAAVLFAAVGFIAGGAQETSKGRGKSVLDAQGLAADVNKSKESIKALADKVEAGKKDLAAKKFPDTLSRDLGGINVDFDGSKLAGRRFSGFPSETTSQLVEFITAVQTLNDRKLALANLLTRLQKPLTESWASQGKATVQHIVVVEKDASNTFATLTLLKEPIQGQAPNIVFPNELITKDNKKVPRWTGGDLGKGAAVPVVPRSFESVCPSETAGQMAQLMSQLSKLLTDLKGEGAAAEGIVQDSKPGLIERADKLAEKLTKVQ